MKKFEYGLALLKIIDNYKQSDFDTWERVRMKIMSLILAKKYAINANDSYAVEHIERALKNIYESIEKL